MQAYIYAFTATAAVDLRTNSQSLDAISTTTISRPVSARKVRHDPHLRPPRRAPLGRRAPRLTRGLRASASWDSRGLAGGTI